MSDNEQDRLRNKTALVYDETRAALYHDSKLVSYIAATEGDAIRLGAICYARIAQVFAKQNRATCQIVSEGLSSDKLASLRLPPKQSFASGDLIWVTLVAMPRRDKPWQAEYGISRAGRLIVLHYGREEIRVSHKAKSADNDKIDTSSMIEAVRAILPRGWGAVIKRAALTASPDDICDEITRLLAPLELPLPDDRTIAKPFCFYHGETPKQLLCLQAPHATHQQEDDKMRWDEIEDEASSAAQSLIILDNGARLHIEQTNALVAIDVDSANSKLAPLALAKAVAPEIMRLIRLASYSGVIVVDMPRLAFRDMTPILAKMRELAQDDSRHPDVLGISRAGLIEIVVRHQLAPLAERL